jgi:hypothetical protein
MSMVAEVCVSAPKGEGNHAMSRAAASDTTLLSAHDGYYRHHRIQMQEGSEYSFYFLDNCVAEEHPFAHVAARLSEWIRSPFTHSTVLYNDAPYTIQVLSRLVVAAAAAAVDGGGGGIMSGGGPGEPRVAVH